LLFSALVDPAEEIVDTRALQLVDPRPIEVLVDRRSEFSVAVQAQLARTRWHRLLAGRRINWAGVFAEAERRRLTCRFAKG
ncbi:MAG: hypothetical protein HC813_03040, partial [Planctomycetes bacterium]|nr:hypothetical protein [Planctomycetota bacterium]